MPSRAEALPVPRLGEDPGRSIRLWRVVEDGHRGGGARRSLADIILDPPTSTSDLAGAPTLDEDWVGLSTVHSARG